MTKVLQGAWQLSLGEILESVGHLRSAVQIRLVFQVLRKDLNVRQQNGKAELLEAGLRELRSVSLAPILVLNVQGISGITNQSSFTPWRPRISSV